MSDDTTPVDLLELLAADHHRIRHLVREDIEVPTLVRELAAHLVAEAQLLYPEARHSVADIDKVVDDLLDIDHLIEEALVDLEKADTADHRKRVLELAVRHADHQEDLLFPHVKEQADPERLGDLGVVLGQVLSEAPSHAHPNLPDHGAFGIIADTLASRIDRWRDKHRDNDD
jgi:hypothetical protein